MTLVGHPVGRLLRELLSATRETMSVIEAIEAAAIVPPDVTARCRAALESGDLFNAPGCEAFGHIVDAVRKAVAEETRIGFATHESGTEGRANVIVQTTHLVPLKKTLYEIERRPVACDIVVQAQRTLAALTR